MEALCRWWGVVAVVVGGVVGVGGVGGLGGVDAVVDVLMWSRPVTPSNSKHFVFSWGTA